MTRRPSCTPPACDPPAYAQKPHRLTLGPLVIGIGSALALLYPLAAFALNGVSLVGITEEGIGYRYFYPLRMLYGHGERPWLFFGQVNGLATIAVQLLLTAVGYPPTQLRPRVEVFAYLTAAVPHIITGLAMWWTVAPLRRWWGQLLVASLFILVAYSASVNQGSHLVDTKYWSWVHPMALVTLGWLLRLDGMADPAGRTAAIGLGLLSGACLALKPSYLVFPLFIVVATAIQAWRRPVRLAALLVVAATVAAVVWFAVIWLYYLGDVRMTLSQVTRLPGATTGMFSSPPLAPWLAEQVSRGPLDLTTLRTVLPLALAASVIGLPRRGVSMALLVGLMAALWIAYRRPGTEIETNDSAFVAAVAWWTLALAPWVRPIVDRLPIWRSPTLLTLRGRPLIAPAAALLVTALAGWTVLAMPARLLPIFRELNAGADRLAAIVDHEPGVTLFLFPTNAYRPLTLDAALQKGGMDVDSGRWGDSPLITDMAPKRWFVVGAQPGSRLPSDVPPYQRIVFAHDNGRTLLEAEAGLREAFGPVLDTLHCDREIAMPGQTIVVCRRP